MSCASNAIKLLITESVYDFIDFVHVKYAHIDSAEVKRMWDEFFDDGRNYISGNKLDAKSNVQNVVNDGRNSVTTEGQTTLEESDNIIQKPSTPVVVAAAAAAVKTTKAKQRVGGALKINLSEMELTELKKYCKEILDHPDLHTMIVRKDLLQVCQNMGKKFNWNSPAVRWTKVELCNYIVSDGKTSRKRSHPSSSSGGKKSTTKVAKLSDDKIVVVEHSSSEEIISEEEDDDKVASEVVTATTSAGDDNNTEVRPDAEQTAAAAADEEDDFVEVKDADTETENLTPIQQMAIIDEKREEEKKDEIKCQERKNKLKLSVDTIKRQLEKNIEDRRLLDDFNNPYDPITRYVFKIDESKTVIGKMDEEMKIRELTKQQKDICRQRGYKTI